ncbi:MAG: choice-of-anchor X domain-containing protein, partial [Planctomycetota bacterium]
MYDDGTNGDVTAGDSRYSRQWYVAPTAPVATLSLPVTATDDDAVPATLNISLTTLSNIAPTLQNPSATPNPQEVGLNVLLEVDVSDDVSVASVQVDLTGIGGAASQAMFDDGTNGDLTASDGTYTFNAAIPPGNTPGSVPLTVIATDNALAINTITIPLTVNPNSPPSVTNASITPNFVQHWQMALLTVNVSDSHGLNAVTVDLSGVNRSATQTLYDDGTNGDQVATDGIYSYRFTPAAHAPPGTATLTITAVDNLSVSQIAVVTLTVARFRMEHAALLEDIHGNNASDIWAVGNHTQVYRYNGTVWRLLDPAPGQSESWYAVFCEGDRSIWVGGDASHVCYYNGGDWFPRDIPGGGAYTIRGIWADKVGKVYAVGGLPGNLETGSNTDQDADDGYIRAVWDNTGSSWSAPVTTTNGDDLNDIFGVGPSDVVAVGDDGLVLHFNGTSWDATRSIMTMDDLFGVWGFNDGVRTLYWAVAGRNSGTGYQIYHFNSTVGTWAPVTGTLPTQNVYLRGVYGSFTGSTLTDVYAVGTLDTNQSYACVWHSTDGQTFNQITVANPPAPYTPNAFPYAPFPRNLADAWMPSGARDVWVAGAGSLQHYVSTSSPPWTEDSRGTLEDTRAVDVYSSVRAITWDHPVRPASPG